MSINRLYGGCAQPDPAKLASYWQQASAKLNRAGLPCDYSVRWIGLDDPTTEEVIELIIAGDKTGTFTLPWLIERTDQPDPASGDLIILVDFHGRPRLLQILLEPVQCLFADRYQPFLVSLPQHPYHALVAVDLA